MSPTGITGRAFSKGSVPEGEQQQFAPEQFAGGASYGGEAELFGAWHSGSP